MSGFDEIFDAYYADVYRFLLSLCSYNEETAEELTQDSFYHAFLGYYRFRGDCHIKTWLLGIAKKRFLVYLRRHRHTEISIEDALPMLCDEHGGALEDQFDKRALIADALKIIFGFPENMRYVFLERIYNGKSYSEIARQLNISGNSARVLYFRGKQLLRKTLKEEYGYELTV